MQHGGGMIWAGPLEQQAGDDVREQQADHGQGQQHWVPVAVAVAVAATVVATVVVVVAPRQAAAAVEEALRVVEQGQVE